MIYVCLSGGLGNQMFQCMAGKLICKQKQDQISYSFNSQAAKDEDFRELAVDKFTITGNWKREKDNTNLFNGHKLQYFVYRLMNSLTGRLYGTLPHAGEKEKLFFRFKWNILCRFGIYYQEYDYLFPIKKSWMKDRYVMGLWQTPSYFDALSEEEKKFIMKEECISDSMRALKKEMEQCNSVCVHIRRGDYARIPGYIVCTEEYYREAMNKIEEQVQSPVFFMFSDDINWVKEVFGKGAHNIRYVDDNTRDYQDLEVMRQAKHFILSNSTFSFWASEMGSSQISDRQADEQEEKIIYAPSRWFNSEDGRGNVIYRSNWKTINV